MNEKTNLDKAKVIVWLAGILQTIIFAWVWNISGAVSALTKKSEVIEAKVAVFEANISNLIKTTDKISDNVELLLRERRLKP